MKRTYYKVTIAILALSLMLITKMSLATSTIPTELQQLLSVKKNPVNTVVGNTKGDVTLIEFTDFNCPYCRKMMPVVNRLIKNDKNLRVVIVEYPVIEPGSIYAAKAALSAQKQGKYFNYHNALMLNHQHFNRDTLLKAAASVGLNISQLQKDMESKQIAAQVKKNIAIGDAIGVPGTPSFIIGKTQFSVNDEKKDIPVNASFGYKSYQQMQKAIADIRAAK